MLHQVELVLLGCHPVFSFSREQLRFKARQVTLLGDDLYSQQPLCEHALAAGLNFIFVCKPQSHPALTDWLDGLNVETLTIVRRKGKRRETDTYRFAQQLPIGDGEKALKVNRCGLIPQTPMARCCITMPLPAITLSAPNTESQDIFSAYPGLDLLSLL